MLWRFGTRRRLGLMRSMSSMPSSKIFDRELKWAQWDHLAKLNNYEEYQYLHNEVGRRLLDRLADIKDASFDKIVDLGSNMQAEHIDILEKYTNKKILQLSPSGGWLY